MTAPIIVVERQLLKSEAFRRLNGTSKNVFFDFLMRCRVKNKKHKIGRKTEYDILNNGEIEYTYSEAEKKNPPISRAAFMRAIDALVKNGFIEIAHSGSGGKKGDKSLYAVSDRWRAWGTDDFIPGARPKDNRQGRGFKSGKDHWRCKHGYQER